MSILSIHYYADGRMTGEANTLSETLTRSHDGSTGHLDSITTTYGPSFGYHFDAANRVDQTADHAGTLGFTYDPAGQLKNDGVKGYAYDAAGNRQGSAPVRNRQTTDGTWTYDSEGNMTGKTRIAGGRVLDVPSRLQEPAGGGGPDGGVDFEEAGLHRYRSEGVGD